MSNIPNNFLNIEDLEECVIGFYFNFKENNRLEACIKRAYRDFNRTLHGISKLDIDLQEKLKQGGINVLGDMCADLKEKAINNQETFDEWHKHYCGLLIKSYSSQGFNSFCLGHAQKWINMTLKYTFILAHIGKGKDELKDYVVHHQYFHVPIDNIMINIFRDKYNIAWIKQNLAWSKINSYADYLKYQIQIRQAFNPNVPIEVECKLFSE